MDVFFCNKSSLCSSHSITEKIRTVEIIGTEDYHDLHFLYKLMQTFEFTPPPKKEKNYPFNVSVPC